MTGLQLGIHQKWLRIKKIKVAIWEDSLVVDSTLTSKFLRYYKLADNIKVFQWCEMGSFPP